MFLTLLRPRSAPRGKRRKLTRIRATDHDIKRAEIEARIAESRQIADEVFGGFARELVAETAKLQEIKQASAVQIERETGKSLQEKAITDGDIMLMLLMIAAGT